MFKLGGPSSWSTNLTGWSTFMGNLAEIVEPCSNMQMRLSLELHEAPDMGAHYETRWMEPLRRLREKTGACCRVVLSTRLRSPADWYVSLYRWGAEPRLKQFNVTLERWASENMQSVLQYWGPVRRSQPLWTLAPAIPNVCLAVAQYKDWKRGNGNAGGKQWFASFGAAEHERSIRMLEDDYQLVWPTERFDDGLRLLPKLLSLPVCAKAWLEALHIDISPSWNHQSGGVQGSAKQTLIESNARICDGNLTRCAEHVHAIAPWDVKLYEHFRARFPNAEQASELRLTRLKASDSGTACSTRCQVSCDRELFGRLTRLTASESESAKRELGELLSSVWPAGAVGDGGTSFVSSWQAGGKQRKIAHADKLARLLLAIGAFPMPKPYSKLLYEPCIHLCRLEHESASSST